MFAPTRLASFVLLVLSLGLLTCAAPTPVMPGQKSGKLHALAVRGYQEGVGNVKILLGAVIDLKAKVVARADAIARFTTSEALEGLSTSLPEPNAPSYSFHLDAEDVEDLSYEGQMLDNTLGLRANGLTLRARGLGITGVVQVLENGVLKCPRSAILEKWLSDLIAKHSPIWKN
ncbi:hypothetical protein B0J17DRAFT_709399 [Rhizoctonia solani]|nr:hypothetical protein B0J17DRAFT_709399 [Rhizoctonia solani]